MPILDLTGRDPAEELAKLPSPTNAGLQQLSENCDRIVIKKGGVYNGVAMSDNILLEISGTEQVELFRKLLKIDEANVGFNCMCLGDYGIEYFAGTQHLTTIGFHHGTSIRYDGWNGDAALAENEALLIYMADLGLVAPLLDLHEQRRKKEARVMDENYWFSVIAPKCFLQYVSQINSGDEGHLPALIASLDNEMPDKAAQIIALLQAFGYTKYSWTNYPGYEDTPRLILHTHDLTAIIQAYENSDRNYKTRRGLARYLWSYKFKNDGQKYLKYISDELIEDLVKCLKAINASPRIISQLRQLSSERRRYSS